MNAVEFLRTLWTDEPPGLVQLWTLRGKRSTYLRALKGERSAGIGAALAPGAVDIYTAVGLTHKDHGKVHRARAEQITALAGLWLDLDVNGGPGAKTGALDCKADAVAVACAIVEPTILVDSGYGLHAWYLFDRPWRFTCKADQAAGALMSAQWYALHRAQCAKLGAGLDGTHDLARLLRLPGTLNGKGQVAVPVHVVHRTGPRYAVAALADLCDAAGPMVAQLSLTGGGGVALGARGTLTEDHLAALLENDPALAEIYHRPPSETSLSQTDMSIATRLANAGSWTNEQIAAVIVAHRARHGETEKARRTRYLETTIATARRGVAERETVREQLAALAAAGRKAA